MKSTGFLLFVALYTLLIISCNDDDNQDPVQTGRITGELRLTNEFGIEFTDHSDMTITAVGKGTGSSGTDGKYEVSGLPSGTFDLVYEKDGFGTYKRFGIQVIAGSNATALNGVDYLGQKSTTEVSNLTVILNPVDSTFNIGCTLSPVPDPSNPRAFRLFFGKNVSVSGSDYHYAPSNTWVATTASGLITGYSRSEFYNNGFTPGETVYAIAYGESVRTNTYTDPVTNKKVFPNINTLSPSNIVSFILP